MLARAGGVPARALPAGDPHAPGAMRPTYSPPAAGPGHVRRLALGLQRLERAAGVVIVVRAVARRRAAVLVLRHGGLLAAGVQADARRLGLARFRLGLAHVSLLAVERRRSADPNS